jgi:hypothetical protein
MLLITLKIIFFVISLWLVLTISAKKIFLHKIADNVQISEFVAFIGLLIMLYVICAIIVAIFIPSYINKIILLLLGASPFIIGKFATFEKENLFSIIQLLSIILGMAFITLC